MLDTLQVVNLSTGRKLVLKPVFWKEDRPLSQKKTCPAEAGCN